MRNFGIAVAVIAFSLAAFVIQRADAFVIVGGGGSAQVEGCPVGYICVTPEEYALHWDVCPIDPDWTPTVTPTDTPEVTPTPTDPTEEPRENCNRGIGNLEEDCDPGNSYGQGGGEARPAGEDRDEAAGAPPPRRGGGNK